ncbi:MAG: hypothetical protein K0U64_09170 [Actinomycetia bacterium]|nr:hypothetical protein [Actinomycetes bacterium]
MRLPWRKPKVPAGVRDAVELIGDERVYLSAQSHEGSYVVASSHALILVVPQDGGPQYKVEWRVRWDQIDLAKWQPPLLKMDIRSAEAHSGPATEHIDVVIDQATEFPAVVRDRVDQSFVVNEEIPVGDGVARVVARTHSDTGETTWRVIMGPDLDPQDEAARAEAAAGLAQLRSKLGV